MKEFHYTVDRDQGVDDFVQSTLDVIVAELKHLLGKNLTYIVLVGGFGRGEGGVLRRNEGFVFANDIDLMVVVSGALPFAYVRFAAALRDLSHQLSMRLNVKQIDFALRDQAFLTSREPTIFAYESIAGGRVLYADGPVTGWTHADPSALPESEGTLYFLNRGSGLLMAAMYFYGNESVTEEDVWNFGVETDKAILAMGDSWLLSNRNFHWSYAERAQRLQRSRATDWTCGAEVKDLYAGAVARKLRPVDSIATGSSAIDTWYHVQKIFGSFFLSFESRRMNHEFHDWHDYADRIAPSWPSSLRKLVQETMNAVFRLDGRRWRDLMHLGEAQPGNLLAVLPLLLFAIERGKVRTEFVAAAARRLQSPRGEGGLFPRLVSRYLHLYHPHGAAKEISVRIYNEPQRYA